MSTRRAVRLQTYAVIARAVEKGIASSTRRYLKYVDGPTPIADIEGLAAQIERDVLDALCEVIRFDEETAPYSPYVVMIGTSILIVLMNAVGYLLWR